MAALFLCGVGEGGKGVRGFFEREYAAFLRHSRSDMLKAYWQKTLMDAIAHRGIA